MVERTLSVSQARRKFLELVRNSSETFDRFVFTKNGKPEAVLLNYEDYEGLLETLDILQDPSLAGKIRKRKAEVEEGKTEVKTHQEVFGNNK